MAFFLFFFEKEHNSININESPLRYNISNNNINNLFIIYLISSILSSSILHILIIESVTTPQLLNNYGQTLLVIFLLLIIFPWLWLYSFFLSDLKIDVYQIKNKEEETNDEKRLSFLFISPAKQHKKWKIIILIISIIVILFGVDSLFLGNGELLFPGIRIELPNILTGADVNIPTQIQLSMFSLMIIIALIVTSFILIFKIPTYLLNIKEEIILKIKSLEIGDLFSKKRLIELTIQAFAKK